MGCRPVHSSSEGCCSLCSGIVDSSFSDLAGQVSVWTRQNRRILLSSLSLSSITPTLAATAHSLKVASYPNGYWIRLERHPCMEIDWDVDAALAANFKLASNQEKRPLWYRYAQTREKRDRRTRGLSSRYLGRRYEIHQSLWDRQQNIITQCLASICRAWLFASRMFCYHARQMTIILTTGPSSSSPRSSSHLPRIPNASAYFQPIKRTRWGSEVDWRWLMMNWSIWVCIRWKNSMRKPNSVCSKGQGTPGSVDWIGPCKSICFCTIRWWYVRILGSWQSWLVWASEPRSGIQVDLQRDEWSRYNIPSPGRQVEKIPHEENRLK